VSCSSSQVQKYKAMIEEKKNLEAELCGALMEAKE
jgi:hypothetical protein